MLYHRPDPRLRPSCHPLLSRQNRRWYYRPQDHQNFKLRLRHHRPPQLCSDRRHQSTYTMWVHLKWFFVGSASFLFKHVAAAACSIYLRAYGINFHANGISFSLHSSWDIMWKLGLSSLIWMNYCHFKGSSVRKQSGPTFLSCKKNSKMCFTNNRLTILRVH